VISGDRVVTCDLVPGPIQGNLVRLVGLSLDETNQDWTIQDGAVMGSEHLLQEKWLAFYSEDFLEEGTQRACTFHFHPSQVGY
jgi:hypothetical protein